MLHGLLLVALVGAAASPVRADNPLDFETFTVKSTLHVNQLAAFSVEEKYSFDQSRGIVSFRRRTPQAAPAANPGSQSASSPRSARLPDAGVFFYDASLGVSLLLDAGSNKCTEMPLAELEQILQLDELPFKLDNSGVQNHLVGPARLLWYVLSHRKDMRLMNLNDSGSRRGALGFELVTYQMLFQVTEGKFTKLMVSFDQLSMARDEESAIPLRIELFREENNYFAYHYSPVRFIKANEFAEMAHEMMNGVAYDPFILTPLHGCSGALVKKEAKLFLSRTRDQARFSSRAHVEHSRANKMAGFDRLDAQLAFDGRLNMLRVDLGEPGARPSSVKQLFNLNQNRVYNIIRRKATLNYMLLDYLSSARRDARAAAAATGAPANEEPDGQAEESEPCVAAPIRHADRHDELHKMNLDQLLLGADKFVYLGRAQVRGIGALVFESVGAAEPPFWLEQPVDYRQSVWSPQSLYRKRPALDAASDLLEVSQLVTLVYISEDQADDQLLMLEIYRTDPANVVIYDKRTIMFYDFVWQLAGRTAEDEPGLELFALRDHCSPAGAGGRSRQMSLLLETTSKSLGAVSRVLTNSIERNFALLAALQKSLSLSANAVYDLQSRLLGGRHSLAATRSGHTPNGSEPSQHHFMTVSFGVTREPTSLVEPVALGRGTYKLGQTLFFPTHCFQSCFMLAAHRRTSVNFGYDPKQRHCFIAIKRGDVQPEQQTNLVAGFELDATMGNLEVYRTHHFDWLRWTGAEGDELWANARAYQGDRVRVLDRKLVLDELMANDFSPHARVEFSLRRLNVENHEPSARDDSAGANSGAGKIDGFGLLGADSNCERLGPIPVHSTFLNPFGLPTSSSNNDDVGQSSDDSEMTLEQCRAVCTADHTCESFSLCIRDHRTECVLSKVSFASKPMADRVLRAGGQLKARASASFRIKFEAGGREDEIQLLKHPNCAIYNKNYLDFFKYISTAKTSLYGTTLTRVADVGECAGACARRNFAAIKSHVTRLSGALSPLAEEVLGSGAGQAKANELLGGLTKTQLNRAMVQSFCFKFYYLDGLVLQGEPPELVARVQQYAGLGGADQAPALSQIGGFCGLPANFEGRNSSEAAQYTGLAQDLLFQLHEFRVENLYEEEAGLSLIESTKSQAEQLALDSARAVGSVDASSAGLLRERLLRGDNSQAVCRADKSACALLCTMQAMGPWPACKSFDIVMRREPDSPSADIFCQLNSVTLNQAISLDRLDLVDSSTDGGTTMRWHYEPAPGFLLESSILASDLTVGQQLLKLAGRRETLSFAYFLLALISGLVAGVVVYRRAIGPRLALVALDRKGSSLSQVEVLEMPDSEPEPLGLACNAGGPPRRNTKFTSRK